MKNRLKFVGTCKNTALKISTAVICAVSIFAAGLFVLSGCSPVKIVSDALLPKTAAAQAADTFTPQGDGSAQAGIQSPAPSPTPSPSPSPSPSPTVEPTPSPLRIVAVGDIMYGRKVGKLLEQKETGYKYAFSGVGEILRTGDVVFGNLESPMTESTVSLSRDSKIILKCRPEAVNGLKDAGFNVVSIANNHMMDFYEKGLLDTVKTLDDNDILHSGGGKDIEAADKPVIMEKNGVKFGLISYSDMVTYTYKGSPNITYNAGPGKAGCMPRDLETIKKDIGSLRGQVDIIAVSLHWGVEESFEIPASQTEFAHLLLDAGADMILGHHPHQFQGMEIYKGKPILYSMGNFLFDQNDPENMESFIIQMEYSDKKLKSLTATPVRILEKCHVEVQSGDEAKSLLEREKSLSEKLGTSFSIIDDRLVYESMD